MRDLTEAEKKDMEEFEKSRLKSITNDIVEYYSRNMLLHSIVVTIVAIRSPTDIATVLIYFCLLIRIIMIFGYYCNKKIICSVAQGGEVFINIILFFITLTFDPYK